MASDASIRKSVVISSDTLELEQLSQQLLAETAANDFSEEDIFAIHLAIEEAFVNAVKHGNKNNKEKQVKVEYSVTTDKLDISVTDEGEGFDPDSVPDPRCGENLYKSSGRGMLLMQSYMDLVEYNEKGNSVHMIKNKTVTKKDKAGV